jgi:glyoxylase-like metal-dependent hydrolase (beta-lactamase superfamily II)
VIEVPGHDVVGLCAGNAGPFTLQGTNTWVVGRRPAWVIDPGPDDPAHVDAAAAEVARRGGLGGIAVTHDHHDHVGGVTGLRERCGAVPVAAARGAVDVTVHDGDTVGPLRAQALPGHAPDHLVYLLGRAAFTGDAVLGSGSVFVSPDPGALAGYLAGLRRLRAGAPDVLCPGHGPLVLDAVAKLDEYLAHRLDRERRLVQALDAGARSAEGLLDAAWTDVPAALRPAAAVTLAAHLDKLAEEGRLPAGVQRPALPGELREP